MLKVDLHLHTSDDPLDIIGHTAQALIDRAAILGFDAMAITLHDDQLVSPALRAHASARGLVLLPGVERTIGCRHVLLLNFPQEAADVRDFDEIRALKSRWPAGLVIAPHPFFPGGSPLGSLMDLHADVFDAVEWSYFWTEGLNFNARAAAWARSHRLPLVGNSDLHDIRQLGRTYSLVDAEADPDAICAAIRRGQVTVRTSPVPLVELASVVGGMAVRDVRKLFQPSRLPSRPTAHAGSALRPTNAA